MSTSVLWTLPVASTALEAGGPAFEIRPVRTVAVRYQYEAEGGSLVVEAVVFQGVEAFKATHYHARDASMLEAYDRLVDRGSTGWLADVRASLSRHRDPSEGLMHLMINFDDGPCYEILCRSFRVESASSANSG